MLCCWQCSAAPTCPNSRRLPSALRSANNVGVLLQTAGALNNFKKRRGAMQCCAACSAERVGSPARNRLTTGALVRCRVERCVSAKLQAR